MLHITHSFIIDVSSVQDIVPSVSVIRCHVIILVSLDRFLESHCSTSIDDSTKLLMVFWIGIKVVTELFMTMTQLSFNISPKLTCRKARVVRSEGSFGAASACPKQLLVPRCSLHYTTHFNVL